VTADTKVNIVTVSSLKSGNDDPAALDNALTKNQAAIASLRTSIKGTPLEAKLGTYVTDDVLAIETGADGSLTVYVDDRT